MPSLLRVTKGAHAGLAPAGCSPEGSPLGGSARGSAKGAANMLLDAYLTPDEQAKFIAQALEVNVRMGDVVIREGEQGNNFFLVVRGECTVYVDNEPVRTLSAGAHCGELGLLDNAPRNATVTASSDDVKLLLVHRSHFMRLLGERILEKRKQVQPFLERVPVLSKIKEFELHALADTAIVKTYPPGGAISRQGDTVSRFRIVRNGCVVESTGKAHYVGDHFGEVELFTKRASEVDVAAETVRGATCLEWSAVHFVAYVPLNAFLEQKVQQENAMARPDLGAAGLGSRSRRMAESAESDGACAGGEGNALPVSPKSLVPQGRPVAGRPQQVALCVFRAACRKVLVFARLDDAHFDQLHSVMVEHVVDAGTVVLNEGEQGNRFYFVASGTLDTYSSANTAYNGLVRSFGTGDSFGELALMYNCPRTATIVARTECVLWSLDRATFRRILLAENLRKASMHEKFLEKVPLLQPLSREERNRIVDALEPVSFAVGEEIISEGERGEHFYLIEAGSVEVLSALHGKLATRSVGDYFGEISLQTGELTIASVVATEVTKVVRMARDAFLRILGPLAYSFDSRAEHRGELAAAKDAGAQAAARADGRAAASRATGGRPAALDLRHYDAKTGKEIEVNVDKSSQSPPAVRPIPPSPPILDLRMKLPGAALLGGAFARTGAAAASARQFDLSSFLVAPEPIGEGGFGKVLLAQHAGRRERYAIKQMAKKHIIRMGQAEHATDESKVLDGLKPCRFIAHKVGSFQTDSHLFLVLELASGGDIYDLLEDSGGKIHVNDARAFVAQLLVALEHLHARSIVHRDVKLENLLVAADGTLKLTDFGFAKAVEYRTFTLCGTPEYLAPEVILNKGYGRGVDYWALGIVLYEMVAGKSPFAAEDHLATYQNILFGSLKFPHGFPPKAADLVSKLLERDITKRYGLLKNGVADIKAHPLYSEYSWDRMPNGSRKLAKKAPEYKGKWVPLASMPDVKEGNAQPLSEKEQAMFAGF